MDKQEIFELLKKNPLFKNLDDEELYLVLSIAEEKPYSPKSFVVREGESCDEVYLILKGKAQVSKKDEVSGEFHNLFILNPGELFGEMAFIDASPRSASVLAIDELLVLVLPLSKIAFLSDKKEAFSKIISNLSKQLTQKLRKTDEVTVRALQAELYGAKVRVEMGNFLFQTLILLSCWVFLVTLLKEYASKLKASELISGPMIVALFLICFFQVKNSIYPRSYFGLNLKNWKKNCLEAFLFTLPFLVLITLAKWIFIRNVHGYENFTLFNTSPINYNSSVSPAVQILFPLIYIVLTPFQEFIARGSLQSSIKASISGSYTVFWSIVLSNLLFAAFHAHLSPIFALFAFVFGIFWGWIYARQGSLIGSCVSHALIGGWSLSALGIDRIFTGY